MRPGAATVFMVLRDPAADMSLSISCPRDLVLNAPVKLTEGTQVVVFGKPSFFTGRGSFSLRVSEIRAVGVGELLARIERLRRLLDAEGLFDPRLKRPLPFLPATIGLITGRASAAEHDVTTVTANRWPAVRFEVRNTAVQGPNAVGADRRGAARTRPSSRRRRDRPGPRRWQRRGPAAVLRRDAVPRDRRMHHAGGQRRRPRTRQPAVRSGGRPARGHADRCRQADRPRRRRRTGPRRRSAPPQLPARLRSWVSREDRHLADNCAAGRCFPTRCGCWTPGPTRSSGPDRDPSRHRASDHDGDRSGRTPVGTAGHVGPSARPSRGGMRLFRWDPGCCGRHRCPGGHQVRIRVSDGAVTAVSQGESDA